MVNYNPWPIGHIPEELQRPELGILRKMGYYFQDPRDVVGLFEHKVALFTGAKYAVSVDCCTHAIELALRWKMETDQMDIYSNVGVPEHTYVSVPMTVLKCGLGLQFIDDKWSGVYTLVSGGITDIRDAAVRWKPGMYEAGTIMCLSFQIKKRIPIGRGGMILTDSKEVYEWCKLWRYDGRDMSLPYNSKDHVRSFGFHYYMTPEDAARGIILMDKIKETGDGGGWQNYPNLKQWLKL